MRISGWSSDVCSSDLNGIDRHFTNFLCLHLRVPTLRDGGGGMLNGWPFTQRRPARFRHWSVDKQAAADINGDHGDLGGQFGGQEEVDAIDFLRHTDTSHREALG